MNIQFESVFDARRRFDEIDLDLVSQTEFLRAKRERLDAEWHGGGLPTVWMMDSWSAADSLQRKENELMGNRELLQQVDMVIVSLYLKVLAMQSSKVQAYLKRLEYYEKRDPSQPCPPDCSLCDYHLWTRSDPKLHAVQSEILDRLSQKVRISNAVPEDCLYKRYSRCLSRLGSGPEAIDLDHLRSRTYFFVEQDPYVDSEFATFVTRLVRPESGSFESGRILDFIHQCWFYYDQDNRKARVLYPYCASQYQEFVCALSEHIINKYGHMRRSTQSRWPVTFDQIYAIIEGHLFLHVSDCIWSQVSCSQDDQLISDQYESCRHALQTELGIKPDYVDPEPFPYDSAISKLKAVQLVKLPTQKLRSIILAAQAVMSKMRNLCSDPDKVAGADDFMDVWVYVVLKARLANLASTVNLLKEYCNPSIMMSETGYYLASLELAKEFIKGLSLKQNRHVIDRSSTESASTRCFVSADHEKVARYCQLPSCPFEILESEARLDGYEVVSVLEWLLDPERVVSSFFKKSPSSSTTVTVCRLRCFSAPKLAQRVLFPSYKRDLPAWMLLEASDKGLVPTIDVDLAMHDLREFHLIEKLPASGISEAVKLLSQFVTLVRVACTPEFIVDVRSEVTRESVCYGSSATFSAVSPSSALASSGDFCKSSVAKRKDSDDVSLQSNLQTKSCAFSFSKCLTDRWAGCDMVSSRDLEILQRWDGRALMSYQDVVDTMQIVTWMCLEEHPSLRDCFKQDDFAADGISDIVRRLQSWAKGAGMYSPLLPSDGVFNTQLFLAVRKYLQESTQRPMNQS